MLLKILIINYYNLMTSNQEKDPIQNTAFDQTKDLNKYQLLVDRLVRIKETIMSLEKKFLLK
tara:strand:+ start:655 stop:840 length:186 start_codon:yes stop_codon:yes gene_type:complete